MTVRVLCGALYCYCRSTVLATVTALSKYCAPHCIRALFRTVRQCPHTGQGDMQRRATMGRWGGCLLRAGTAVLISRIAQDSPFHPAPVAFLEERQNPAQSVHELPRTNATDTGNLRNFRRRGVRAEQHLPRDEGGSFGWGIFALSHGSRIPRKGRKFKL